MSCWVQPTVTSCVLIQELFFFDYLWFCLTTYKFWVWKKWPYVNLPTISAMRTWNFYWKSTYKKPTNATIGKKFVEIGLRQIKLINWCKVNKASRRYILDSWTFFICLTFVRMIAKQRNKGANSECYNNKKINFEGHFWMF